MRMWIAAGAVTALAVMAQAGPANAQDGARATTLAAVKSHRAEWAGLFMRVENVTISGFAPAKGGLASDSSGVVRLDDAGMPTQTIAYLQRHCAQARPGAAPAGCRGSLEFTVPAGEAGFTITDAQFIPEN